MQPNRQPLSQPLKRLIPGLSALLLALVFVCSATQAQTSPNFEDGPSAASQLQHLVVASHSSAWQSQRATQPDDNEAQPDHGDFLPLSERAPATTLNRHTPAIAPRPSISHPPAFFSPSPRAPPAK
ncbi:hypothetical protein C7H09_15570 [Marinobacter fuscus]|uniref:Secreted protein n=1 Tax=Marinobacter fuscus TaxID=2109942 RepID=A0A2T1K5R3_9GAMM|nr:hypothetical protein [Marinobacter fuscus]PSF05415.1 hypothetical protein C7H09_15570 [Marinobacter fuscus]